VDRGFAGCSGNDGVRHAGSGGYGGVFGYVCYDEIEFADGFFGDSGVWRKRRIGRVCDDSTAATDCDFHAVQRIQCFRGGERDWRYRRICGSRRIVLASGFESDPFFDRNFRVAGAV
jgi:hypothetical protein